MGTSGQEACTLRTVCTLVCWEVEQEHEPGVLRQAAPEHVICATSRITALPAKQSSKAFRNAEWATAKRGRQAFSATPTRGAHQAGI